jgi:hypothetical protein
MRSLKTEFFWNTRTTFTPASFAFNYKKGMGSLYMGTGFTVLDGGTNNHHLVASPSFWHLRILWTGYHRSTNGEEARRGGRCGGRHACTEYTRYNFCSPDAAWRSLVSV